MRETSRFQSDGLNVVYVDLRNLGQLTDLVGQLLVKCSFDLCKCSSWPGSGVNYRAL